jgi:hypothetical protein
VAVTAGCQPEESSAKNRRSGQHAGSDTYDGGRSGGKPTGKAERNDEYYLVSDLCDHVDYSKLGALELASPDMKPLNKPERVTCDAHGKMQGELAFLSVTQLASSAKAKVGLPEARKDFSGYASECVAVWKEMMSEDHGDEYSESRVGGVGDEAHFCLKDWRLGESVRREVMFTTRYGNMNVVTDFSMLGDPSDLPSESELKASFMPFVKDLISSVDSSMPVK